MSDHDPTTGSAFEPGPVQPGTAGSHPGDTQEHRPDAGGRAGTGPRTGTVVGALVLVLLGLGVAAVGLGARLDLQAALIVLLLVTGSAVLVGAVLSARRRR